MFSSSLGRQSSLELQDLTPQGVHVSSFLSSWVDSDFEAALVANKSKDTAMEVSLNIMVKFQFNKRKS
jgi:hypothetical protein